MKKNLGIAITYYYNSIEVEKAFKDLMRIDIINQVNDKVLVYIYEDGQHSPWLLNIINNSPNKENFVIGYNIENKGIAYARNKCLEYLKDKVDYILFIDSDDIISSNYIEEMYKACKSKEYDIVESTFIRHGVEHIYSDKEVRTCVAGSAFKSDILGDLIFDEQLQIGEDTKFFKELVDLSKHKKYYCKDAIYYYNYGVNPNSLIMRFNRGEIDKYR